MRTLGRLLLVLMLVGAALVTGQQIWNSLRWNELAAVLSGRIESALPSTAYRPIDGQWLEFNLSGLASALRVRSNATVEANTRQPENGDWWYAFDYQLLAADGQILRQGVYHHRTRLTRFRESGGSGETTRNFMLDPQREPTDGRIMMLYFAQETPVSRVRIRPIRRSPELRSLLFRIYEKVPNPKHQLGYLWQRLAESKKVRLARGSVYGAEFLDEQEKQNLLRYEWKAVGPLGVKDEHYEAVKLYIARELAGEIVDGGQMPFGLYCAPDSHAVIPIPEGEWKVNLGITILGEQDAVATDLRVRWYGRGITQRWQTRLPAGSGEQLLDPSVGGGQLELICPVPLVVRAEGTNETGSIELTPESARLRAYLIDGNGSLKVDIDHVRAQSTPFRVDVRARLNAAEDTIVGKLEYELLDGQGKPIRRGRLATDLKRSIYDRLNAVQPGVQVSEPVRYYFSLAADVSAVRFSSQQELLITTYTRPPALPRKLRVPEDYQAVGDEMIKQPAWFVLRPAASEQLRRESRSLLITVQQRPPETDPRLLTGDYDWRAYQPTGNWRARHLLIPKSNELPIRDRSLAAVYRELDAEQPVPVRFRGLPGLRDINPSLLYLREQASPLDVRVMLGDKVYSTTQIAGRQGELLLPSLAPGTEQVAIAAAEPVRWFINQAEAEGPVYLRRLAMQVDAAELAFDYLKESHETEMLSGELFTLSRERTRLQVQLVGETTREQGPWQDWSFRHRLFDLKPEVEQTIPVLNSAMKPLAGRQRFFLPLGSDLPPGRYRISFSLENSPEAFLTLYRLTPGKTELRTFFRETADAHKSDI